MVKSEIGRHRRLRSGGTVSRNRSDGSTSAAGTKVNVNLPHRHEKLGHGHVLETAAEALLSLQLKNQPEVLRFHAVVQEAVITDFLKAVRQHVHEKTADKLRVFERNRATRLSGLSPAGREGYVRVRDGGNPSVRYGNLMGVAPEILHGIAEAVEGLFDVRAPVLFVQGIAKGIPTPDFFGYLPGDDDFFIFMELLQEMQKFPAEFIPQHEYRDEKFPFGKAEPTVLRKASARNDAVHVHVIVERLIPRVKHLNDSGRCPEMLRVGGQLQKRFGTAFVKETVKEFLIAVKERIQLVRESENDMEIRSVDHLGSSAVRPLLLPDGLTVRTVAVPAGMVSADDAAAIVTAQNRYPQTSRLTKKDGTGGPPLNVGLKATGIAEVLIGSLPNLLNREISHGRLPSGGQADS